MTFEPVRTHLYFSTFASKTVKQLGNKQYQRKTESLVALLIYRLAQGSVEYESFTALLQQVLTERIKAKPVSIDTLSNSVAQVQLGKLPKTKRLKEEFRHFFQAERVKNIRGFEPSLAANPHSEGGILQPLFVVSIGVDGDLDPFFLGVSAKPPIEVQAIGMGIEFNRHS
jgi:hypothetical protein